MVRIKCPSECLKQQITGKYTIRQFNANYISKSKNFRTPISFYGQI